MQQPITSDKMRRRVRLWLLLSALLLIGAAVLLLRRPRQITGWLVLASSFANVMVFLLLERVQRRSAQPPET